MNSDDTKNAADELLELWRPVLEIDKARAELALELELEESGQVRLGVEGDQIALDGLAEPLEPAPLNHTPERTAAELMDSNWAHGRPLAAGIELEEPQTLEPVIELEEPVTVPTRARTGPRRYLCAYCARELEPESWIYSSKTGSRYCPPSDPRGCNTPRAYAKQERARARKG